MKMRPDSGDQSCFPPCFHGILNLLRSLSSQHSPGISSESILACNHGRSRHFDLLTLPDVTTCCTPGLLAENIAANVHTNTEMIFRGGCRHGPRTFPNDQKWRLQVTRGCEKQSSCLGHSLTGASYRLSLASLIKC